MTVASPTFVALGVPQALVDLLATQGITTPSPIQAETLPDALAGRDVLGKGRTGSGKTYAFVLPVLTRLAADPAPRRTRRPRALILAPTRELVTQIQAALEPMARTLGLRSTTIFGGVGMGRQIADLRAGVDIVIACPGRLDDHAQHGQVDLGHIEITVLDEADHMADLGFLPVVRRLLDRTPREGQRLLFSATLDAGVDVLVRRYLHNPVTHDVDPGTSVPVASDHHVLYIREDDRLAVLVDLTAAAGRAIVFTRTKHRARALTRKLVASGVPAVELHGNLAQNARDRNLTAFSEGSATTLVATDIAARGIHVDDVRIIIHADPPAEHKAYLHRSGRTARAGATGTVVTLSTEAQRPEVRELTRKAGITATATSIAPGHPLLATLAPGGAVLVTPPAPAAAPTRTTTRSGGSSSGTRSTGSRSGGTSSTTRSGGTSSATRSSGSAARSGGSAPAAPATDGEGSGSTARSGRSRPRRRRGPRRPAGAGVSST